MRRNRHFDDGYSTDLCNATHFTYGVDVRNENCMFSVRVSCDCGHDHVEGMAPRPALARWGDV